MALHKHLATLWKSPSKTGLAEMIKARAIGWRHGQAVTRIERPTRLNRARALGYRAKQGYVVARVRIRHGGLHKTRPAGGRRQKRAGIVRFTPAKSLKEIAIERVAKKFPNLVVLNSYWIWKDGKYNWYEAVLVDPHHPAIVNDPKINWISKRK